MNKNHLIALFLAIVFFTGCEESSRTQSETSTEATMSSTTEPKSTITTTVTEESEENLEEIKSKAADCVALIDDASILLSNVVNYEYNYWKANDSIGGSFDSSKAVENAKNWLSEKGEVDPEILETSYRTIVKTYTYLTTVETTDSECKAIIKEMEKLFNAYSSLYTLSNNPNGSRSTFVDSYNECVNNIKSSSSILHVLLNME